MSYKERINKLKENLEKPQPQEYDPTDMMVDGRGRLIKTGKNIGKYFKNKWDTLQEDNDKYKNNDKNVSWHEKLNNAIQGITDTGLRKLPIPDMVTRQVINSIDNKELSEGLSKMYHQGRNEGIKERRAKMGKTGRYLDTATDIIGDTLALRTPIVGDTLAQYNNYKIQNKGEDLTQEQRDNVAGNALLGGVLQALPFKDRLKKTKEQREMKNVTPSGGNDNLPAISGTGGTGGSGGSGAISTFRKRIGEIMTPKDDTEYTTNYTPPTPKDNNPMPTFTPKKYNNETDRLKHQADYKKEITMWQPLSNKKDNDRVAQQYYREYYEDKEKSLLAKGWQGLKNTIGTTRMQLFSGSVKPIEFLNAFQLQDPTSSINARDRTIVKNQIMGDRETFDSAVQPYYDKMKLAGQKTKPILGLRKFAKTLNEINNSTNPNVRNLLNKLNGTSSIPDMEDYTNQLLQYVEKMTNLTAPQIREYTELMNDIVDSTVIANRLNKDGNYKAINTGRYNKNASWQNELELLKDRHAISQNAENQVAQIQDDRLQEQAEQLTQQLNTPDLDKVLDKINGTDNNPQGQLTPEQQAEEQKLAEQQARDLALKTKIDENIQAFNNGTDIDILKQNFPDEIEKQKFIMALQKQMKEQKAIQDLKDQQQANLLRQKQEQEQALKEEQDKLNEEEKKQKEQEVAIYNQKLADKIRGDIYEIVNNGALPETFAIQYQGEELEQFTKELLKATELIAKNKTIKTRLDEKFKRKKEKGDPNITIGGTTEKKQKIALENQQKQEKADGENELDKLINSYLNNQQNPIKLTAELEQKGYNRDEINQSIDRVTKDRKAQRDRAKAVADELNNIDEDNLPNFTFSHKADEPNTVITGMTGNGKTNLIKKIVNDLTTNDKDREIVVIDPSQTQFNSLKGKPNVKIYDNPDAEVGNNDMSFAKAISDVYYQIHERDRLLQQVGANNIEQYNQIAKQNNQPLMKPLTMILDEYKAMNDHFNKPDKNGKKGIFVGTKKYVGLDGKLHFEDGIRMNFEDVIDGIAKTGRKVGISSILAQQSLTDIDPTTRKQAHNHYTVNKSKLNVSDEEGKSKGNFKVSLVE